MAFPFSLTPLPLRSKIREGLQCPLIAKATQVFALDKTHVRNRSLLGGFAVYVSKNLSRSDP